MADRTVSTVEEINALAAVERWIRIDAAALGLGVGMRRAYQLADEDHWRRTGGKPTRYALSDVRATHARRSAEQAEKETSGK